MHVRPSPTYPGGHAQSKPAAVLMQVSGKAQRLVSGEAHSSTATHVPLVTAYPCVHTHSPTTRCGAAPVG